MGGGRMPCFLTFFRFLFRMHLKPGKPPSSPPNLGKNLRNRRRRCFLGPFPGFHLFGGTRSAPFGLHRETIMDINKDDRKDVQPHPVEPWPESRRRGEGDSSLARRGGSLGHCPGAGGPRGRRGPG